MSINDAALRYPEARAQWKKHMLICVMKFRAHFSIVTIPAWECVPVGQSVSDQNDGEYLKALAHLTKALEILDASEAPANIGAHVDLAICKLREMLQGSWADGSESRQNR